MHPMHPFTPGSSATRKVGPFSWDQRLTKNICRELSEPNPAEPGCCDPRLADQQTALRTRNKCFSEATESWKVVVTKHFVAVAD